MPIFRYSCIFPNFDGKLTWANIKEKIPSKTFPMLPVEEIKLNLRHPKNSPPIFCLVSFLKTLR